MNMAKIAYFDCFSGISGDMTLGAFLDAGLDMKALSRELKKLRLNGYELKSTKVKRGALTGTKFDCIIKETSHPHYSLKDILLLIDKSALTKKVKENARNVFTAIGEAEARIHGLGSKKDIKFHELGAVDSIIDIVGTAIALEHLGIDEVYSSVINFGRAFAETEHGTIPIPAPAALELLKGAPAAMSDIEAELVTPTGAGILKVFSRGFGRMPAMKIEGIGYGAGSRDLQEIPNMLRVVIGEKAEAFSEDRIFVIETNIDDISPQNFEYLFDRLFKEGALDVYTENIQMKKTRPAFKLTVLADGALLNKICAIIFSETTTIGVRFHEASRFKLERNFVRARTRYGDVNVKVARGPGNIKTVSPEYEECARLARESKVPLKTVYEEAKRLVKV